MSITVIYHRADFDGLFSGAVCKNFMPQATFIGWDYGDPVPPVDEGTMLFLVDISIPQLMDHPEIVWIDHHASAIQKFDAYGWQIDGVAACRLCWQWFNRPYPGKHLFQKNFIERTVSEPQAIRLAGEYDIWDKRDVDAELFQYGLVAKGYQTIDDCLALLHDDAQVMPIVDAGRAAFQWQQAFASSVLHDRGYLRDWEGLKFCILGSAHARNSMWFPTADIPAEADALMCWRYDGIRVAFSLYHKPSRTDLDLSPIAVKYGGGGHRGACGFVLSLDEALKVIA